MSVTRIMCLMCGFAQVHCRCKWPKVRTPEERKNQTIDGIHTFTTEAEADERREELKKCKF